jgi:hypothetical protein
MAVITSQITLQITQWQSSQITLQIAQWQLSQITLQITVITIIVFYVM